MEQSVNEHYRQLLQLPAPWKVEAVDADLLGERVAVRLVWPEHTAVACPVCGRPCGVYDRLPERSWRHLSVMQYLLELRCAVPRGACPEHGVKTVAVPWAEPGSRFSLRFEAFAVQVIAACRSLTQAAELLRLHWDAVQRLIERAAAPQAAIVHDKFHVAKQLNEAVDKVRREEHRRLLEKGDESLKNTKYLW